MPPVVVVSNGASFSVCDLLAAPTATVVTLPPTPGLPPATAQTCVVAALPDRVAAGNHPGPEVHLYDVSNPSSPSLLGTATLPSFGGSGALAMQGTLVAAAEFGLGSTRIFLIDFATPANPKVISATTSVADVSSLAFTGPRKVVGASSSGPPNCVEVDFPLTGSPIVTTFASPFATGSCVLAADPAANRIIVGEIAGGRVALLNSVTKAVLTGPMATGLAGVTSVAISGTNVLAASDNDRTFRWIDFAAAAPSSVRVDPNWPSVGVYVGTGNVVALEGRLGACGQVSNVGTMPVARFTLPTTPTGPITIAGRVDTKLAPLESIGIAQLVASPPPAARLEVSPVTGCSFGAVRVLMQAQQQALTLRNTGTGPLDITAIVSSNPQVFPLTAPTPPLTLQPNGQATVMVGFVPAAETAYSGNLAITSNGGNPTIPLSGTGALPHIAVSPVTLDLEHVFACGLTSLPKQVAIANNGGLELTVSSVVAAGPFSARPASLVVAPGTSQDVSVDFTPPGQGAATGSLTIASDDPDNPTMTVELAGTGDPPQPPVAQASPAAFDFRNVRRQYFSAMVVTIANRSACQNLVVTSLVVTGTGFSLTETNEVTGATMLGPHTIPANQAWKPLVVFAPAALGAATGTLTITTNDQAHPTLGPFPLTGSGVDEEPAALALVLDRSGSMADSTPGGTKMGDLRRTVGLFADVVLPGQGDEVGSVWFDGGPATPLTPLGPYDAAKQAQITTDVGTLTPSGGTSVGSGLVSGSAMLAGSTLARKVILVFTDGKENLEPFIPAAKQAIQDGGIEAYAVGLGRPQDINADTLSDLAWSSGGKFFQTDDSLLLRKHFVQVLVDAFRQNVAMDPVRTIQQGRTLTIPVSLTDCERRVTFVLAWESPSVQLGLEIEAPDGTLYTPTAASTNKLVRYGQDVCHRWYGIAFPPVDQPPGRILGPQRNGTWVMRVTGAQVAGAARFTATVLVESDLDMNVRVSGSDTTRPLTLDVTLDEAGSGLAGADVRVRTTSPTRSISELYGPAALSRVLAPGVVDELTGFSLLERASRLLRGRRYTIGTRTTLATLVSAHGSYRLQLPPPLVPGLYQFEVEATGQGCGGTFQRYACVSYYVAPVASSATTGVGVTPGPGTTATVMLRPTTGADQALGPGLAAAISGAVRGGRVESVVDNLDGSYTIGVRWSKRTRRPVLTLDVGGTSLKIPLSKRRLPGGEASA